MKDDPWRAEAFIAARVAQKGNRKTIRFKGRKGRKPLPFIASNDEDAAAEKALVWLLAAHPKRPAKPFDRPVDVGLVAVYTPPAHFTADEVRDALGGLICPTFATHHDRGNVLKLVEDALATAGWIANDRLVCGGSVGKAFGPEQGYRITVEVKVGARCARPARPARGGVRG